MLLINLAWTSDVNECEENPGICDQDCHNTEGSFYYSCRDGFVLGHDGECEEGRSDIYL